MTKIFISHSYADEDIAFKLVNFLLAALEIKEREIFCSSNPDQGASYSSDSVTDQLKQQLIKSEAIIILVTINSLQSAWVPFEAGAFWTTDKPVIPILAPGLTQNDLPGPLRNFLSIAVETSDFADKLNNSVNQLAKSLNLQQEFTRRRKYTRQEFAKSLQACPSQMPVANSAQQEELEQLKVENQELKQDLEREKKQYESAIKQKQTEKEELEKNNQLLQSQIDELKQELQQKQTQKKESSQEDKSYSFEVISVDKRGQIVNKKPGQAKYFREELGDDVTLDMVYIPGGKFLMGTEDEEIERLVKKFDREYFRREKPQHQVKVKPFYMGKYPVTQEQWQEVMGNNPAKFKKSLQNPVEQVSWNEAQEFCQKISQKTGKNYRLPSEAEWEYACRAGTTTPFYFGETITGELANYRAINIYDEEKPREYREETTPVGSFTPNAFGLYDMHGNVWEWCEDDLHDNYEGVPTDGSAWLSAASSNKVGRGGSWLSDPDICRSAIRYSTSRVVRDFIIGFRVVCVVSRAT